MVNLTRASQELFSRAPDERFSSLVALAEHCQADREKSADRWHLPQKIVTTSDMTLCVGDDGEFSLNDWSFSQLCRLAGVSKETINRLSHKTASRALQETLPSGDKPIQVLTSDESVRSLHGVAYTRLWNADLLAAVQECAAGFEPPPVGFNGATGLYCGEQDLFAFLIDPGGWTEIGGESFAPGFFVWNSEVGRRSVGIQTFWFQQICQNHIVWDATEVVEFTRKHTARVGESLNEIRRLIEALTAKRDDRKDGFAKVIKRAMETKLGDNAEEVLKALAQNGIPRAMAKQASEAAMKQGRFTIFSLVDALTRLTSSYKFAGDRLEADAKAASLLALAV